MGYNELDIYDKMAKAFRHLNTIRPFYSSVYQSLKRVVSNDVDTMGVSEDTLYINEEFVNSITFEQFMFINLHEIAHVALMHPSRVGNRDPLLWNIAADFYVNKLIADEFDIKPGECSSIYPIEMPVTALYNDSLDLDNDYVEKIYSDMEKEAERNGYKDSKSNGMSTSHEFNIKGSGNESSKGLSVKVYVNTDDKADDLIKSETNNSLSEVKNKGVLNDALARNNMNKLEVGKETGNLEFRVNEIVKSHLNWKKLLKRYCRAITRTDTSYSMPDRRMYYQKAIYPGQVPSENKYIDGIKICFDTSGSISSTDIAGYYGQVKELLKEFKVDAELIFWDTECKSAGSFNNFKAIYDTDLTGRGGTDPSCLFEYFDSKECKTKPVVTLIFTDGFINEHLDNSRWIRKYKDTIWIFTKEHNERFSAPFGKKALAKYAD